MIRGKLIFALILCFSLSCTKERTSTRRKPVVSTPIPEIILEHIGNPSDAMTFRKAFVTDIDRGIESLVLFSSDVSSNARFFAYNPVHIFTENFSLEGSKIISAYTQQGFETLYIGTGLKANLFKYNLSINTLENLDLTFNVQDRNGNSIECSSVTAFSFATDRKLYIGASPGAHFFSYNTTTNSLAHIGNIDEAELKISSILGTFGDKVYISTYPGAKIFEYDLITEEIRKMIDYNQTGSFEALTRVGDRILTPLYPSGRLFVIDPYEAKIDKEPDTPETDTFIPSLLCRNIIPDVYDAYVGSFPTNHIYQYRYRSNDWDLKSQQYGMPFGIIDANFIYCLTDDNHLYIVDKNKGKPTIKRRLFFLDGGNDIGTLCLGPDNNLYGANINNPHLFSYNHDSDRFTDIGILYSEGRNIGNLITINNLLYIFFSDCNEILSYDPTLPWNPGNDVNSNPRKALTLETGTGTAGVLKGPNNIFYFTTYPDKNRIYKLDMSNSEPQISEIYKSDKKITGIKFNPQGALVIGTETEDTRQQPGLIIFDPEKKETLLDLAPIEKSKRIGSFHQPNDIIVYGAADSTFFIADIVNKKIIFKEEPGFGEIFDMTEDNNGNLYILSRRNLLLLNKESNDFIPLLKRRDENDTDFFYKDPQGRLFVAAGRKLYELKF